MTHPAVEALRQFADPANWDDDRWIGKQHPLDLAIDVLASLEIVCTMCHSIPPYGGTCPHAGCYFRLDRKLQIMQPLRF